MVRGFNSWNVPLSKSLNSMPSRSQKNGLRVQRSRPAITSIQALQDSDFVLSCSAGDAAVNIWSTKAGLTRISGLNFKLQMHIDPKKNSKRAQLYFLNYDLREIGEGMKTYLRKKRKTDSEDKNPKKVTSLKIQRQFYQNQKIFKI